MTTHTALSQADVDRMRAMFDKEEIRDLIHRYASSVDTKNWRDWEACFTSDAVIVMPFATHEGREGLEEWGIAGLGMFEVTEHLYGNIQIALNGDTASSRMNFWGAHTPSRNNVGVHFDEGGSYAIEYRRVGDQWLMSHLVLDITWTSGDDIAGLAGEHSRSSATSGSLEG